MASMNPIVSSLVTTLSPPWCVQPSVIEAMRSSAPSAAHRDMYVWMDARAMDFKGGTFHVAVDKGTLDGLVGDGTCAARLLGLLSRRLRSWRSRRSCISSPKFHQRCFARKSPRQPLRRMQCASKLIFSRSCC